MKTANLAIVFTDIKGFTERTSRSTLGQNETFLGTHSALLAPIFRSFSGKIIKEIGDAFLVTFESPTMAVLAGVAIQDRLWQHNRGASADERLEVRVAINVGEVRVEGGDVFGEPVNIAARIEGLAEAGEVWFSEAVYLSMNKAEVPAEEVGAFELKGIPGKVRVYRVPRAPYRVEATATADAQPAAPSPQGDQPPYGNLGLSKMPDDAAARMLATTADLTQKAMDVTSRAVSQAVTSVSKAGWRQAVLNLRFALPVGLAMGALVVLLLVARGSAVERAIDEVASAPTAERSTKVAAARKLIGAEKDAATRSYLQGRLSEAQDDPGGAAASYTQAARAGSSKAEGRIVDFLRHDKCPWRVAGLRAVQGLKLKRAKGRVEDLAEEGGPGDGETLLFLGCNSKQTAQGVLESLKAD